jgi:hypothetical protein
MNGIFETGGEDGKNGKFRMGVRPIALGVVAVFFVGVSARFRSVPQIGKLMLQ